jgi:hypothetical protein
LEKITFNPDGDEAVDFFVLEQTRVSGIDYILVTEEEDGDGDALILKDTSNQGDLESVYEIVSDEKELDAVAALFETLLEDISFAREDE